MSLLLKKTKGGNHDVMDWRDYCRIGIRRSD